MFENKLITRSAQNSKKFSVMMDEVTSVMSQSRDIEQLRKTCGDFIDVLEYVGGPAARAGENLKCDWNEGTKSEFGFIFLT